MEKKSKKINFFDYHRNFSFTSMELKKKRILALLLKKIALMPYYAELAGKIIAYMLSSYEPDKYSIE